MKSVAIKKDQTRDKAIADFQAMGILRCETCLEDFVILFIRPRSWIRRSLTGKRIGSKRFLPTNAADPERSLARIREGANGPQLDPGDRRYIRPPHPRSKRFVRGQAG